MADPSSFDQIAKNERQARIREVVRIAITWLSLPLVLLFWIADHIYAPELKWHFLGLRLLIVPACIISRFFVTRAQTLTSTQLVATFYTAANSLVVTAMIFMVDGSSSPYYAGLNLVGLGMSSFIPWTSRFWCLNLGIVYLPYLLGSLVNFSLTQGHTFILNSFFMLGTVAIMVVVRHYNEQMTKKELLSRIALEEELLQRESVIRAKTQQELNLRSLTRQFSPQVVHAISSGSLDIHKSIHRSKICAIFVDIVNSTERIVRLDKDALDAVLSMYMEDTMKVLLKYDITIDKFLGDGVLGFSNDPVQYPDHIQRVACAALEIRARIEQRQAQYLEHWRDEFQIRIGIDVGYANVGFYGHEAYLKSYTAIGPVMNLANRLCSQANPNQILVTNDVAKALDRDRFILECMGNKRLKGFESDLIKIFDLQEFTEPQLALTDVTTCPAGHGVLHLETNAEGIYVLRCRSCEFSSGAAEQRAA